VTVPSLPDDLVDRLATLQREIEQVHQEVHELADEVADLRRAWDTLPGWVRWLGRIPSRE
jgi:cell division septum initiation protein DivIVA